MTLPLRCYIIIHFFYEVQSKTINNGGFFKMAKDEIVQIKISKKDKEKIKKFGGSPTTIFWLGFDKWLENIPSELQKKRDFHQKMYLQCNDKLAKCNDDVITKNDDFTKLCHEYLCQGRSAENPTKMDLSWIEVRTKDMSGVSSDKFLEHAKAIPKETIKLKDSESTTYGGSRKLKVDRRKKR